MNNVMKIDFKQSLSSIANTVKSIETKAKNDIREIPLSLIKYNPKNKFGIRDIEKLADSLKEYGQLHNAVVRSINDPEYKFELISGERRHRALNLLGMETILAMVIDVSDDEVAEAMLIITNLETREVSDLERSENAIRLAQIVENRRQKGDDFKGKKTRQVVADMMTTQNTKVCPAVVQKLFRVQDLIQEFKDMLQSKEITLEKANQFAQMTVDQQKLVYEMFEQGKEITASEAKELKVKLKSSQENQNQVIEDMKRQIQQKDKEKSEFKNQIEVFSKKLKTTENEKKNAEENLNMLRKNLNEVIEQKNIEKKEFESLKDSLKQILRTEIAEQVNKEVTDERSKRIKELEDALNKTAENEAIVAKLYEDKIKELQKGLKEQEERNKRKNVEETTIQGNIEILSLAKQTHKVLGFLVQTINEYGRKEGFAYSEETRRMMETIKSMESELLV